MRQTLHSISRYHAGDDAGVETSNGMGIGREEDCHQDGGGKKKTIGCLGRLRLRNR